LRIETKNILIVAKLYVHVLFTDFANIFLKTILVIKGQTTLINLFFNLFDVYIDDRTLIFDLYCNQETNKRLNKAELENLFYLN
jgi:hypothetical protein